MEIFGLASDAVTAEHRRRAKAVNFGIIYGQGDSGLAKSLRIPRDEARSFIAAYFRRYEGVRRFMDLTLESARAGESVMTLFGRRRLVPEIRSSNRARRLAAERIAMNTPIQGTAADLLKMAMLALRAPVTEGARLVLTVHDELVFEVPEKDVPLAAERIRQVMESVHPLRVPLVVDVGHGRTWSEAH
jgi:DNA polymerase-1